MKKKDVFLTLIAIAALFGVACFVQTEMDSYIRRIVNLCLVYAIIGLSMNLTNGFVGQFSLGQAGFMAIGAYVVGIFTVPVELRPNVFYAAPMNPLIADIQMPLWLALIAGGLLAALVAFLIGTPVLRLRGDYLAVATLGFSEIIRIFAPSPINHCDENTTINGSGSVGPTPYPPGTKHRFNRSSRKTPILLCIHAYRRLRSLLSLYQPAVAVRSDPIFRAAGRKGSHRRQQRHGKIHASETAGR